MTLARYLLQASVYLIVFYAFYFVALKRQTFFTLNRVYLLAGPLISLAMPHVTIQWLFQEKDIRQTLSFSLPYGLTSAPPVQQVVSLSERFLLPAYLTGLTIALLLFIGRLMGLKKTAIKTSKNKAFSFFRFKVVDQNLPYYPVINAHEQLHIKQLHSADILFFELLGILFWFNPVINWYKQSIKQVHEFLADCAAARYMGDNQSYALLLLHKSLGLSPVLANTFQNTSLLKSRIFMLQRGQSRKRVLWRYASIVPLIIAMSLFTFAKINHNRIEITTPPNYPGGLTKFQSYLITCVKTSKTLDHSAEGKVKVGFMINTEGAVTDIKIVESTNSVLNKEAIKIMEACPNWLPGKQNGAPINVSYQINLRFQPNKQSDKK